MHRDGSKIIIRWVRKFIKKKKISKNITAINTFFLNFISQKVINASLSQSLILRYPIFFSHYLKKKKGRQSRYEFEKKIIFIKYAHNM